jgi:hypothetical protein
MLFLHKTITAWVNIGVSMSQGYRNFLNKAGGFAVVLFKNSMKISVIIIVRIVEFSDLKLSFYRFTNVWRKIVFGSENLIKFLYGK